MAPTNPINQLSHDHLSPENGELVAYLNESNSLKRKDVRERTIRFWITAVLTVACVGVFLATNG